VINEDRLSLFRKAGFQVIVREGAAKTAKPVKLVKGRCEIHLSNSPNGLMMEIPVVRNDRQDGQNELPKIVADYLSDRNSAHKGPGRFVFDGDIIWYRAFSGPKDEPQAVANGACNAVEKLGPKILNLLR
jgi:hypothetical protein